MMLGDMGADVIKVEPPGKGDDTRAWGPPFAGDEAAYFLGINRNKRSLTLNMAVPAGQKVLAGLIEKADVLIDNFKLGTWRNGASPTPGSRRMRRASCAARSPATARAARRRALPGYDFILQAESGLMSICGEPDGGPTKYGVAIVDVCTGMLACKLDPGGAQRAPPHRQGPEGRAVALRDLARDAGQRRPELSHRRPATAAASATGIPSIVPYTTYRAADGDDRARGRQRARSSRASPRCSAIRNGRRMRASTATGRGSRTAT